MVNSPTGHVSSYKSSLPYTTDDQKAIVITTKDLQKEDALRGDDSTVIRRGTVESIKKIFSGDENFDLMYKKDCTTRNNPMKLIQKLNTEQKSHIEKSFLSGEKEKNNIPVQKNKNHTQVKNTNISQNTHNYNIYLKEKADHLTHMHTVQKVQKIDNNKNTPTSLTPEIRAVKIAQRNVELEKSELKKIDENIKCKRDIVDQLSDKITRIQTLTDIMLQSPFRTKSFQNKQNRIINEKKDECTAAENLLNIAIESRKNKRKRITEAMKNLKIAEDNLANAKIKTAEKPRLKLHENLKKEYGENNSLLAQEFAKKYKGKVIEKINQSIK